MATFATRRLLALIPTLLVVSAITFFMGFFAPGDPVQILVGEKGNPTQIERVRHQYGLDQPPLAQYGHFLWQAVHGDLGLSYAYPGRSVTEMVAGGMQVTLALGALAMLYAGGVGVLLGIIAAANRNGPLDLLTMFVAIAGVSLPNFVLAVALMYLTGVRLGWLPVAGWGTPAHFVLPALVLGTRSMAFIARITRSSMLDVLHQDYIRTARAKGLSRTLVIVKHAVRNALVPVITVMGTTLGGLLTGAFITEVIFSVPGLGQVAYNAITTRDYPVIQVSTLLIATVFIVVNLVVDLMYGTVDPRIRYA